MDEGVIKLLRERGYNIQHTLGEGAYSKVNGPAFCKNWKCLLRSPKIE